MRKFIVLVCLILLSIGVPIQAQSGCDLATSLNYPIDTTNTFRLAQNFGTASPRHQGKYHTGEDWYGGHNASLGQPVRAAGAGVVTYSSPNAWGRDGGVIIIRHTFNDGTIYYSQYGHLAQTDSILFPSRLSCVEAGALLGVIGSARPAPHLHFEIRTENPDTPGPGYTRENPTTVGWQRPAQVIANMQARLNSAYLWAFTASGFELVAPPLLLNDNSVLIMSEQYIRRVTLDGRVLWRVAVDPNAVYLMGYQAKSHIVYNDGTFQQINPEDGLLGDWWYVENFKPDGPPIQLGENSIYHTTNNELVALNASYNEVLWRLENIPAYQHGYISETLIALVIDDMLWLISHQGQLIDRVELRKGASMSTAPDGTLITYTRGGLWRVAYDGVWSAAIADAPAGGGAVHIRADGQTYLLDGETIYTYNASGDLLWQARLPQIITGQMMITQYDQILLITSSHGHVVAIRDSGGVCGATRVYGDDQTTLWHHLGDDRILRIANKDQLVALDWQRFTSGC